jgi:hypothetical protein
MSSTTTPILIENGTQQTTEQEKSGNGLYGVLGFYSLSFAFWVWLFVSNTGPGGVESQHLVLMGLTHLVSVVLHSMAVLAPQKVDTSIDPSA